MNAKEILLPAPSAKGTKNVEATIYERRSWRQFDKLPLTLTELGQLLWAAQGAVTKQHRTVPSASRTFPLSVWLILGHESVFGLEAGVFIYQTQNHSLASWKSGDLRAKILSGGYDQQALAQAPVSILICGDHEKIRASYRTQGDRFLYMEAGHAAQNISLQAVALDLGSVAIGSFIEA